MSEAVLSHAPGRPVFVRLLKWMAVATGAVLVALPLLIYGLSERRLHQTYDVPLEPLKIAPSQKLAEEGGRRAFIMGCRGCHHDDGNVLFEAPGIGHLVAPNLTRVAREYSNAELVRLIRRGVKRDGTSVIAMPAGGFEKMSDEDLSAIISWLRTLREVPDAQPSRTAWGPLGRVALATGKVQFSADAARAAEPPLLRPASGSVAEGAYLVKTICSHCHELDQEHDDGWGMVTPALRMMGQAYPTEDFRHLLRTGKGMGDRELGLMSSVARGDLSHMTDSEIDAIHAYLNEREGADQK